MDIVEELSHDYCNCLDDYKIRGRTDPQCESCSTKVMRHEAANEIESLRQQLAEANAKVIFCEDRMIRLEAKIADLTARLEAQEASEAVAWTNAYQLAHLRDMGIHKTVPMVMWKEPMDSEYVPLYLAPQPTPNVQAAVAAAYRKAAEVCRLWEYGSGEDFARQILALPHDDSALREFGVKIARATYSAVPKSRMQTFQEWAEAIVDRVLGEKK